jgi:hypothetical protein
MIGQRGAWRFPLSDFLRQVYSTRSAQLCVFPIWMARIAARGVHFTATAVDNLPPAPFFLNRQQFLNEALQLQSIPVPGILRRGRRRRFSNLSA